MSDSFLGLIGVVVGTILGYLGSYFHSRQERKWRIDAEYKAWLRDQVTQGFGEVFELLRKFYELAHLFVEYCEEGTDLAASLLIAKQEEVRRFLEQELRPFPVALKLDEAIEPLLRELGKITDDIEELALPATGESFALSQVANEPFVNCANAERMRELLEAIRENERNLYAAYLTKVRDTFT